MSHFQFWQDSSGSQVCSGAVFGRVSFQKGQDFREGVVGIVQFAPSGVKRGAAVHLGIVPESPH